MQVFVTRILVTSLSVGDEIEHALLLDFTYYSDKEKNNDSDAYNIIILVHLFGNFI
jgi:hypothetical protein